MKGTFFNKPLEWNLETIGEFWHQGDVLKGFLKLKNHGPETVTLANCGVSLAHGEIKKVQSRTDSALKFEQNMLFAESEILPNSELLLDFTFLIGSNSPVTDKKSSYYLCFGKEFLESQLQVRIEPKALFTKVVGLLDTFHRFKLKETKGAKKGVEFKFIPPTSREMANVESMIVTFFMDQENLCMKFDFQVKKIDTSSVTTKINKETVIVERSLGPKEYSLGRDMINQDLILKSIESALSEVKMKNVF